MSRISFYSIVILLTMFWSCDQNQDNIIEKPKEPAALALDGSPLYSSTPSEALLEKLEDRRKNFITDSSDVMNWIWYGRFLAYAGEYDAAEDLYTRAINKFPEDERLLRHRGHRYISTRKFNKAISDLSKASKMIVGKENKVEPDGMPNAQNIPVSTTHGNIWYHLGLAQYLQQDFENALISYQNCLATGEKPDNVVSATHWIYMILNRLGKSEEAKEALNIINTEMDIIENLAYHKLCLFYKGEISEEELLGEEGAESANDAVLYGLGNFYYYNGSPDKAWEIWEGILEKDSWNSFGYIAAESEKFMNIK